MPSQALLRTLLHVKVAPKSSRNAVTGWMGATLKIAVTAAPEKGKANEAVIAVLARVLAIAPGRIEVVAGHGAPSKRIAVHGLGEAELRERLQAP